MEANKEYLPMQPGDMYQIYADIDELKQDFGLSRARTLRRGLENLLNGINGIMAVHHRKVALRTTTHLLTFACMAAIFYFSSQPAEVSSDTSGGIIEAVVKLFMRDFGDMPVYRQLQIIDNWQYLVRKCAHFLAYFSLGFLAMASMLTYKMKLRFQIVIAFAVAVVYAVSDEVHQMFVPGRAAMLGDVLLDSAGAAAGLLAMFGISARKASGLR